MTQKHDTIDALIRKMFRAMADHIRQTYGASHDANIIVSEDGDILGVEERESDGKPDVHRDLNG